MQLLLDLKDNSKANLLIEFLKSLNYVSSVKQLNQEEEHIEIPEAHKKIVLQRIKNAKPENFKPYSEVRTKLKKKYGI